MSIDFRLKRGLSMVAVLLALLSGTGLRVSAQAGTVSPVDKLPACPDKAAATLEATAAATDDVITPVATKGPTNTPLPTNTPMPTPTTNPTAGYLGIAAEQVQKCGARVLEVKGGSPAEKAGLQAGDVIVAVNGKAISGVVDLRDTVRTSKVGDALQLTFQRGVEQRDISVTLVEIPKSTTATLAATTEATPAATASQ